MPTIQGGSRYILLGSDAPEGGPEPDYFAYIFVFFDSISRREAGKQAKITGALGPTMLHKPLSLLVVSLFVDCTSEPFKTKPKSLCN